MTKGRPTTYRPEFAEKARQAYKHGACDEEVARELEIGIATFYRWRHTYPEFAEACTLGREHADSRVELSLFQRVIGFEYTAERSRMFAHWDKPMIETYTKRVLGDPRLAIQWLRHRKPEQWSAMEDGEDINNLPDILGKALRRVKEGKEPGGQD